MRNLSLIQLILILLLGVNSVYSIESVKFEEALWSQVQALSLADYKKEVKAHKGGEVKEHKDWKKTIDSVFKKLETNSGNPNTNLQYSILKDSSFNAFAYPGGQFIIHTGLLDEMDKMIAKDTGAKSDSDEFLKFREAYLAPVIAHELGHYYNRHSYKSYLAKIEKKKKVEENEESRDLELDADMSGILLLQKAGYDINYFTKTLEYLNELRQKELKEGNKAIPYFQSHPSPNERLSKISAEHKDLYAWAAKMEYLFADIQTSRNLDKAIKELEEVLTTYPDNLDFQKAKAVALHKIWLESALVDDLKLKSIVDLPSFRDSMVFDIKAKKAVAKKIPGDRGKFNKTLTAYREIIKENSEPWLVSNFAVLLVYSPEAKDEAEAIKLAKAAFKVEKSVQTLNNLAFCYSIAKIEGDEKLAKEIFREMARVLEPEIKDYFKGQSRNDDAVQYAKDLKKGMKNFDELDEDVNAVFLNLALTEYTSKSLVNFYITNFDSSSKWAEFLSKTSGVSLPAKDATSKNVLVDGIQLGTSIKELLTLWNEPDRKPQIEEGYEVWFYDKKSVKVSMRDGFVRQILLYGDDSPTLGEVKIGSAKSLVEKELGKEYKKQNRYIIFEKKEKISLSFDENKVERIIIHE